MESLPKRSDDIYKEIESFEEYELTQCVAYEMAVRNSDIQEVLQEYASYVVYTPEDERIEPYSKDYKSLLNQKLLEKYFIGFEVLHYLYILESEQHISAFHHQIDQVKSHNTSCITWLEDIYKDKIENIIKYMEKTIEDFYKNLQTFQLKNPKKFEKSLFRAQYYCNNLPLLREVSHIDKGGIIEYKDEEKVRINNKDFLFYKKPKLEPPKNISYEIDLKINLALPQGELIDYLRKIKQNFDKKKLTLTTPLDSLGIVLDKAVIKKDYPKKPTALKMADMFFIYDYVKARQNYIQKQNKSNEAELEAEIENIKKYHTGIDRKTRIAFAKAENLENIINTKITDIFKEDELINTLGIKADNISKLYYAIKPYIDDFKYKELITGISAI